MSKSRPVKPENAHFYKIMGENLSYFRKKRDLTLKELAEKVDVSVNHLSSLESSLQAKNCSLELIFDLSTTLGIEPSWLLKDLTPHTGVRSDGTYRTEPTYSLLADGPADEEDLYAVLRDLDECQKACLIEFALSLKKHFPPYGG